jgi:hypothetical protein
MRFILVTISFVLAGVGMASAAGLTSPVAIFTNGADDLGGVWLAVARNGAGFDTQLKRSAHICNVASSVPLTVAYEPVSSTSAPPPWKGSIAQGQCTCVDNPAALFVENEHSAQAPFSGSYQWLSAKACKTAPTTIGPTLPSMPHGTTMTAKCAFKENPDGFFGAACAANFLLSSNRLCFSDRFIHVRAGNNYPVRFVRLVADERLLTEVASQYDIRWSYIAKGCIDLINVHHIWFVVHGDTNFSPRNVDKIIFTVRPLL